MVNMTSLKGIDKIKIIEKGIHPRVNDSFRNWIREGK
jgi:hypothetical protein